MSDRKDRNQLGFSLIELMIVMVILLIVIGILATIVSNVGSIQARERPRTEAINDATAALDSMTRLIRMAGNNPRSIVGLQGINPGLPVAGQYRTIRIRSDWRGANMDDYPDGDTNDGFENVLFSVSNNRLMKQETPADTVPQIYLDNVSDLTFTYYDTENVALINPALQFPLISRVDIALTVQVPGTPGMTFTTSAFARQK